MTRNVTIGFIIGGIVLAIFLGWALTKSLDTVDRTNQRLKEAEKIEDVNERIKAMNAIMDEQIDKPFGGNK